MNNKKLKDILVKPAGPDCNLACTYCFYYEKYEMFGGKTKSRMSEEILEILIKKFMQDSVEQPYIGWQGGEPTLMGLGFFKKAVEFQKNYGNGRLVMNGLQTNGFLINKSWAGFLRDNKFLVGLSIDGPEHIHDHYRKMITGKGTWERVKDSAVILQLSGVIVNSMTVINNYSVDFPEEIYSFLKGIGLNYMQYIPCVETDSSGQLTSFTVDPVKYGKFLCKIFDLWISDFKNGVPATSVRFFDTLFHYYVSKIPPECSSQSECGIYLVVEHNGNVYPCDFFVEENLQLGNIRNDSLSALLNSTKQKQFGLRKKILPPECIDCKWLKMCFGGCVKDRVIPDNEVKSNHLCTSFKQFFEYSENTFITLAREWEQNRKNIVNDKKNLRIKPANAQTGKQKSGRNDLCQCGSGLKYKKCCLNKKDIV